MGEEEGSLGARWPVDIDDSEPPLRAQVGDPLRCTPSQPRWAGAELAQEAQGLDTGPTLWAGRWFSKDPDHLGAPWRRQQRVPGCVWEASCQDQGRKKGSGSGGTSPGPSPNPKSRMPIGVPTSSRTSLRGAPAQSPRAHLQRNAGSFGGRDVTLESKVASVQGSGGKQGLPLSKFIIIVVTG